MSDEDWATKYAAMNGRVTQKYEHLPKGEQIGKRPEAKPNNPLSHSQRPLRRSFLPPGVGAPKHQGERDHKVKSDPAHASLH